MSDECKLDVSAAMTALDALINMGSKSIDHLAEGVGMAALKAERQSKQAITDMLYSKPERGYRRTGTLRRGIHAASPNADHSGDDASALGEDLGGKQAKSVVRVTTTEIESEVGTWIRYSAPVHDGNHGRAPVPFLDEGLKTTPDDLEHFTLVAIDDLLGSL